jgi:meso-butanediol dehydrogenase/(S,S)-butanediol dehydrogenase/diacetyl reductase
MANLTGKVALITGAGGEHGVGRAIALKLGEMGARVIVNDIVNKPYPGRSSEWEGLPQVVRELHSLGTLGISVVADISHATQVQEMVEQGVEAFGQIDILVANAGSRPGKDRVPLVELEEDAWDLVQKTNVKGTFLCCQAVARHLIERDEGGKIVVISSVAGKMGIPRYAAYCASKFALIGLTQSLAHELAPHGINVNAICPGLVDTERVDHMATALGNPEESQDDRRARMIAEAASNIPLGRVAKGADIADVAGFLSCSESDYLTGLSVSVSGGMWMG